MKILTVRQPWASLIVAGLKDVENRSWKPKYRGRIGIHAAMGFDQGAIDAHGHLLDDDFPLGALLGSVMLMDCIMDSRESVGSTRRMALDIGRTEKAGSAQTDDGSARPLANRPKMSTDGCPEAGLAQSGATPLSRTRNVRRPSSCRRRAGKRRRTFVRKPGE